MPCGIKQNGTVLGDGIGGAGIRRFYIILIKRGKEWWDGIRGDAVFGEGAAAVLGFYYCNNILDAFTIQSH